MLRSSGQARHKAAQGDIGASFGQRSWNHAMNHKRNTVKNSSQKASSRKGKTKTVI